MSLDSQNHNNNSNNTPANKPGAQNNMSTSNPLFALLGSQNLITSSHTITEVDDVMKSIEEMLKTLNKNTGSAAQKLALPQKVQTITRDISPNLPGISLHTVIGETVFVMPVLFFKVGVTEVTESVFLANEPAPRGIAKPASSFMDQTLMEKIKTQYTFIDGKQYSKVIILAPIVRNLEPYIKNQIGHDEMISDVRNTILKEWSTSLFNIAALDVAKAGMEFPNPFKDGKMFGKDDAAAALFCTVSKLSIDGAPTPYNLAVKISTTNKNNTQNTNSSQSRSVATSYMTVSLEAMSMGQFAQARAKNPGNVVGPLIPVISTGLTVPGETMNNNSSLLTALLGLYASIGANNISYFSEAFRGKEVGHRGNIGNFNSYLTQILQGAFGPNQVMTDKNLLSAQAVNNWLNTYVAPKAVYVLDLPCFTDDVANSDFWWNLVSKPSGSTYHRALVNLLDVLSNKKFSELAQRNAAKGQNRNPHTEWVAGDPILKATNIILPNGIAQGKDGKWFSLAEVDGMFLRQDTYYGQNENAITEYQGLICGSVGGDNVKIRQYNIYNRLNQLFGANVILDGWNRRFIWENAFFATFAEAMSTAGALSLSGSNMASLWQMNTGNDYLNYAISAQVTQSIQTAGLGFQGSYSHY